MNIRQMRRIDRWLGVPVCFALTLWRRCFGRRAPAPPAHPQKILFIKMAEQGSTVLAQDTVRAAVDRVGRGNVYFLLFEENRPILDLLDVLNADNIFAIRTGGLLRTILSAIWTLWRIRRAGIDAVIDLEFFARSSAALGYLSGARWRVGYHGFSGEASYRGDLMTHRLSFNPYLHASQAFRIMVEALDYPPERFPSFGLIPPPPQSADVSFVPAGSEVEEVRALLGELVHRPVILLNANCSDLMPLRRWPVERYVRLAERLLDRYPDVGIVFTGAPSEAPSVEELVQQVGSSRCVSLAGRTTLRQLLVLYGLAEVLVTNDSGPAHFATLTPVDVVVLFGPETPALFAARSPRTHPLWAGLACSPCINAYNDRNSTCRDNLCMTEITVERVLDEVAKHYEARVAPLRRALPLAA